MIGDNHILHFTVINNNNTYGADPVKLIALSSGELVMVRPKVGPSEGTKLTTPGGIPASSINLFYC